LLTSSNKKAVQSRHDQCSLTTYLVRNTEIVKKIHT